MAAVDSNAANEGVILVAASHTLEFNIASEEMHISARSVFGARSSDSPRQSVFQFAYTPSAQAGWWRLCRRNAIDFSNTLLTQRQQRKMSEQQ